jgi:flagellar protein FliO/FliZ
MDFANYLKFFFVLVFVLSLIGLMAWLGRRLGGFPGVPNRKGNARRLQAVESLSLDARRRVILVRRDDVEHLIVLGPNSETVVETGIPARAGGREPSQAPNGVPNTAPNKAPNKAPNAE